MAIKTNEFPGIYPQSDGIERRSPALKTSDYFKALYDQKVDKKYTPNTIYGVDKDGKQVMITFEDLGIKDAPADNKQYARENKEWQEVDLQKVKLVNIIVNRVDWITGGGSEDYPLEYRIYDERILASMVPTVIFSEEDALGANFSPICESFNGYVSIYAKEIPESEITIPLVTLQ